MEMARHFSRKTGAALTAAFLLAASITSACGREKKDTAGEDTAAHMEFHADNDIAMTLRSITDAIRLCEPLDSTAYGFHGVLTDGTGRPLYTALSGMPGKWDITVLSDTCVYISNTEIGDLLPADLESYIAGALGIVPGNVIDTLDYHGSDGSKSSVYDFGGGYMRLEVRNDTAPNGISGSLMRITASKGIPR